MAVALSWTGFVDTDISFSEFFGADHTIVARFMAQYPDAYEGPVVAEQGSGTFALGMGDFSASPDGSTKIMLVVGGQAMNFPVAIAPGTWHHLAVSVDVTTSARVFRVHLDGDQLGTGLTVASSTGSLPSGTLRIGKRTSGKVLNDRNAQFYGLVSEVGVFDRALTTSELGSLAAAPALGGAEKGLLAGISLRAGRRPARLARSMQPHGAAHLVATSGDHDSAADRVHLPLPTAHQPMDLPFPPGEAWKVIQGVNLQGGSHRGYACFCWDFVLADQPQAGVYPDGSDGAPLYAAAPGKVVTVRDVAPSGPAEYSNYIEVEQAPNEYCATLHVRQDSAEVEVGDDVATGAKLALTGDTGVKVGAHHPHVAVSDFPDKTTGFVTFPVAFRDYERRTASGGWTSVARGMPLQDEVVRNPPMPRFLPRGLSVHGAVTRGPDDLDVVATDLSGRAWRAHWAPGRYAGNWDRWRPVLSDVADAHTPVSVVSLDAKRLDVFAASSGGGTFTAAWDERVASGVWRGWWHVQGGTIPATGAVTAVSRGPGKLDAFHVSHDGGVWTAAWDHHVADGKWRGWWRIDGVKAVPGSHVEAVAREATKLDVFVAGVDGRTYTAAWDQHVAGGKWRGWWNILTGRIPPAGVVTAVSRRPHMLDIFHVSTDGRVYTAAWDHHVAGGKWRGWWPIGSVKANPGAPVGVVARDPDKLDVFVAGADGKVWTAAWDHHVADGKWRGWWHVQNGRAHPGSAVAVTSRRPHQLDIFVVGKDGGMYTAAWDHNVAAGKWRGWWHIG